MSQHLSVQSGEYVVEHHPEGAAPPAGEDWVALVRAPDGLTVVRTARAEDDPDRRWAAFYSGAAAHGLDVPGMLAALVNPLAQAAIPVFVASTYHADLVLVPAARKQDAAGVLRRSGHLVQDLAGGPD